MLLISTSPRSEDDGRPHDAERDARLRERLLGLRLAPEVGQIAGERRIGDADVHDARDARASRRVEQRPRLGDRLVEVGLAVLEANPVRVVERGHAFEAAGERDRVVEAVRPNVEPRRERGVTVGVRGQGPHGSLPLEQLRRDVATGVAQRPGDEVDSGVGHGVSSGCGFERGAEQLRERVGRREERCRGCGVAVELGEQLEAEIQRDDAERRVTCRHELADRGAAEHAGDRRLREVDPRADARGDLRTELRDVGRGGDELRQDLDVARGQVLAEDGARDRDELGQRSDVGDGRFVAQPARSRLVASSAATRSSVMPPK